MAKRVFLSYRFKEIGLLNNLLQFFQSEGGPIQATPTYATEEEVLRDEKAIKEAIHRRMEGCAGLLVLVADDTHNSRWINYEGGVANELKIPKAAVRHPSGHGALPNAHRGMQEVEWNGKKLAELVEGW